MRSLMNVLDSKKFKDDLPLNTINKIRNILNELGILAVEKDWQNSANGYYSVNLMIPDTNLFTNGKGTSYEFALASAYGELMERLQNYSFLRLNKDLSDEALAYKDFYYAPDEKALSIKDILASKDDWFKFQLSHIKKNIDSKSLLEKWKSVSYESVESDFIGLPYVNYHNGTLSYIPIKMLLKMYMTNGMCAGNTLEEALIQGISEVLERYINKKIIRDKITPPTIPSDYIKNFPKIENMLQNIISKGNFSVILKDCSLNEGYPVVAAIFINHDNQSYFIKFGAHPVFDIAVERTLTELLQGQNIKNMNGVREYSYTSEIKNEYMNLLGILVNGSGCYPREMFTHNPSYPFNSFVDVSYLNNKEMLTYLLQFLKAKRFDLFVRDVSFLGFPSFHVIIPGISEIDDFDDIETINSYGKYNQIKKMLRNIETASEKDTQDLYEYLEKNYNNQGSVTQLLNLPTKDTLPWYFTNINLFFTALHYKKYNFSEALKHFNKFFNLRSFDQKFYVYYKCVRDYLGTRIDNLSETNAIANLATFYPLTIVQQVVQDLRDPKNIFRFGHLKCWDCHICQIQHVCLYQAEENVYLKLKARHSTSRIVQNKNSFDI